jgi:hypothetical protein
VAAHYGADGRWLLTGSYHCWEAVWLLRLTLCELTNVLNVVARPSAPPIGCVLLPSPLRLEATPAGALL